MNPRWRRDGRELFYATADGFLMAVDVKASTTLQLGVPHRLFKPPDTPAGARYQPYDFSRDGQKFLFVAASQETTDAPIEVTINWQQLLKNK